jgi:hypothetical protein
MSRDEHKFTKDRFIGKGIPKVREYVESVFHTGEETASAFSSGRLTGPFLHPTRNCQKFNPRHDCLWNV